MSEAEFAELEERARSSGLTPSEWVRAVLLAAPVDGGPDSEEVALGEILALPTLLLNLHFRAAKDEPGQPSISEPEMRAFSNETPFPSFASEHNTFQDLSC